MNRVRKHVVSVLLLSVIVLAILGTGLQVEAFSIAEWTVPTAGSEPLDIAFSGGYVYFTENSGSGNRIGRLDTQTGIFTEWGVPTAFSYPWDIAGSPGYLYFTENGGNKIGRLDPATGIFTE